MTTRVTPGLKRRNSRGSKVAVIAALIAATFPGTGVPGQQTPSPPDERPSPSYFCDLGYPNPLRNTLAASANATHAFARGALEFLDKVSVTGTGAMKSSAKDLSCDSFHRNAGQTSLIRHVVIESATAETPRSDTASIAELSDGRLMVVYHRYERGWKRVTGGER